MKRYGYLGAAAADGPSDSEALYGEEAIEQALRQVQLFGDLPQTGKLDKGTLEVRKTNVGRE
jgi:hypothetical protein